MQHEALFGKICLVTGSTGFIGRHLCRLLAEAGAEVHGLSRRPAAVPGVTRPHAADLTEASAARDVVAAVRPDLVFHLASHVTGSRGLDQVLPAFAQNLGAAVHLLHACASAAPGARVVMAGSMEEPDLAAGESSPCSPYAAAKAGAQLYARMFLELHGLAVSTARIFMVYGPGEQDEKKLVPHVIRHLLRRESPPLGPGTRPVDWIHVEDVARGLVATALAPAAPEPVDLGSGGVVTVRALVERIHALMGAPAPLVFGAQPPRALETVRRARPESSLARTGWSPRVSLDDGLRSAIAWFSAHPAPGG